VSIPPARIRGSTRKPRLRWPGDSFGSAPFSRLPVRFRNYLNLLGAKRGLLINLQQSGKKPGETKLEIREVTP